jgi:hypothetical protein
MTTPVLTTTEVIGENCVIQQLLTLFGSNNMGSNSGGKGGSPLATLEHDVSCVIVGIVNALEHHTTTG